MKQAIFNAYAEDQELNSIRALSLRFGISLKRVEAIIRLKALEFKWRKVRGNIGSYPLPLLSDEIHTS